MVDIKGYKVVVAYIVPNDGTLYQAGNSFWIRRGTNTVSFSGLELKDFLYRTGSLSWETQPVTNATMEDLNPTLIDRYLKQRAARGAHPRRLSDQNAVLITIGAARLVQDRQGHEVIRPTNAGLLHFGEIPQDFIRQAEVVCVLFSDNIGLRRYRDRRVLTGTISEQIEQIEAFLNSNIKVSSEMQGFHRVDIPDYPIEALREAVVNAVVHRDYSITGETIRIFYYADRVEIHSPGLLMPGINLAALKHGQFLSKPRNPVLCDVLKDLPGNYMERIGSGIKFMVDSVLELGKPEPFFTEENEFVVTFFNGIESRSIPLYEERYPTALQSAPSPSAVGAASEPTGSEGSTTGAEPVVAPPASAEASRQFPTHTGPRLSPNERQEKAIRYIQRYGSITNKEYRRINGVSESAALRDLEGLAEHGSLRAVGHKRTRKYLL